MRFFSSPVRPDESTGAVMRWVHRIWVFFWLTVLGAGIGLLSLYLTAHSYASIDATALLQSYFKIPLLVMMNLLAPILLVYLGFFLFAVIQLIHNRSHGLAKGQPQHTLCLLGAAIPEKPVPERFIQCFFT